MERPTLSILLSVLLLTAFMSCSEYDNTDNNSSSSPAEEEQTQEGIFRGVANAVNPDLTRADATIQIEILNDNFTAEIVGTGPSIVHGQYIHEGTRCPDKRDDLNADGVIDSIEGQAVYGVRMIPLDSDLESTTGDFPIGAIWNYLERGSLIQILATHGIPFLSLEGKVVTIQ